MALPTINLDDRTYAQLLGILKSHIPGEEWSDHNPSDPGIALLEMLTWLGEMSLYRMNRVPVAHQDKFLKLLADPPVPVTVDLEIELKPARTQDFVVPAGLRFATDYKAGKRYLFDTISSAVLTTPVGTAPQKGTLRLRAIREVAAEVLGKSNGEADQVFPIAEGPVLVDFAAVLPGYVRNPQLTVDGVPWELRPFLLSEQSHTPPPLIPKNHFMVDEFENQVRFGNGTFGAIPVKGQVIALVRYQALEGPAALVATNQIMHILNPELVPDLAPSGTLSIREHADAQGGQGFFTRAERMRRGLESFRGSSRLITASDFERVATADFNVFQGAFNAAQGVVEERQDFIARAVALMNRQPPLSPDTVKVGHVTLVVVPWFEAADFDDAPLVDKIKMTALSTALTDRLTAFLEPHRLITTRLHVVGVELEAISAQIVVIIEKQRNTTEMVAAIVAALEAYLNPVTGYEGRGWPLGRAVRRSQLYSILEGIPGVDHVESLALSPGNLAGDVELTPQELPVWSGLNVQVKRA